MVIRYDSPLNLLVSTKGHPFDRNAFSDMFDAMRGMTWTHIEQPATAALLSPEGCADFDAILFYDVPGLQFRTPEPPALFDPPETMKAGFTALLDAGKPMIFLHHAMAGWPTWDPYAEAIGARFFYQPGTYKDRPYPDSGYLFPATYRAKVLAKHPVTSGLGDGFEVTDELYLFEMLETGDDLIPLLAAEHRFTMDEFYSAKNALEARMWTRDGWTHGPGTNLVAWAKRSGNAPTVTVQMGNDGKTFGNENFRTLVRNAVDWVTSDEAARWARNAA
ncbi:ThuA domain-containing protein [Hoeflea poritis]|uniref:ThuA domain-containing protein n=1 Tax=Hoeflea poritis TaxID=2993659 RepID=A0ABT4VLR1_9HYPH|nr:ThuA domain-containing protein [Hoeflea poritis]MDA4845100.1 ThuA domain-containing protein [Hoeflea poritis]